MSHLRYRADIDGLRAIAILSVVAYHAFPNLMPGGFVGVDIFFVISGYLISSIIFKNLEDDSFSILEFYRRRIRRIFPAMIIVMAAILGFGWLVLFRGEFRELGKHIAACSAFLENFNLLGESGYFDTAQATKPTLHFWSLAVEEQFYIFWPLLLWGTWKYRWSFLWVTLVVGFASFSANIYLLAEHQGVAAFYLPISRFWELMVGGVLAYSVVDRKDFVDGMQNLCSVIGMILIVLALLLIKQDSSFPGWWALLPVMGAFFVIAAGPSALLNRYLLSNNISVTIGLISYPLYLWHWPILSYGRILMGGTPKTSIRIVEMAAAFILAWLTYKFVESPVRKAKKTKLVPVLSGFVGALFMCGLLIYQQSAHAEAFSGSSGGFTADESEFQKARNSDGSCEQLNSVKPVSEEVCISNSKAPSVLFVGDSHAMALYSAIANGYFRLDSMLVAGSSCPEYANLAYTPTFKEKWGNNCTGIAKSALSTALAIKSIKTVVIATGFWYPYNNEPVFHKDGKSLRPEVAFYVGNGYFIQELLKAGKKVVFVEDYPQLHYDPADCVQRVSFIEPKVCEYTRDEYDSTRGKYINMLSMLKKLNPPVSIFMTDTMFCNSNKCVSKINGKWLYHDFGHISVYASQLLLNKMSKEGLF